MADTGKRYGIFAQGAAFGARGYLTTKDGLSAWRHNAQPFMSVREATDEISRRGWVNDTGVRTGVVTAYVVELS